MLQSSGLCIITEEVGEVFLWLDDRSRFMKHVKRLKEKTDRVSTTFLKLVVLTVRRERMIVSTVKYVASAWASMQSYHRHRNMQSYHRYRNMLLSMHRKMILKVAPVNRKVRRTLIELQLQERTRIYERTIEVCMAKKEE